MSGRKGRAGKGNPHLNGCFGNTGNIQTGEKKQQAGKRSGLRRSTKYLLTIRQPWLNMILSGWKTWEIRSCNTKYRDHLHLAQSGGGGQIIGRCKIIASFEVTKTYLHKHVDKHRIKNLNSITYSRPYVWVLRQPIRYEKPFVYSHPLGAVVWVRL